MRRRGRLARGSSPGCARSPTGEESALRALRNDARRVAARFPAEPWRDFLATLAIALDTPTRTGTDQG